MEKPLSFYLLQTCFDLLLGFIPALIVGLLVGGLLGWNRIGSQIGMRIKDLTQ
jgi:ABC-type nitrate/sulfonate/bicarbonate transport system permease component